jgi:hypothetical protein
MELQAVTGKLYTIEGTPQENRDIPGLVALSPPGKAVRGRARDFLFVHLSLSGQPEEYRSLAHDLVDGISSHFYSTSGSVTATLRQAIMQANQTLLRMNLARSGATREGAITCAVLREQELFVVQAGEAFALIGRNFGMERLPPQQPERITPLGRSAGLDLRYFHNWLEAGDMLLLADPRISHLPQSGLKPVLVDSTVEDSLPQLARMLQNETARLLLVEFTDETPVGIPETVMPLAPGEPSRADSGRKLPPPTQRPQRQDGAPAATPPAPRRGSGSVPIPDIDLPSTADLEHGARRAGSNTARGLAGLTGWLADLMHRLRPGDEAGADDEEAVGWALPALLSVLIPVIVVLIVSGVYIQRGRVSRVNEIRLEMQQALASASSAPDEAQARAQYLQVMELAAEADLLRPGDEQVRRLRLQAQGEMDRIDDISRLTAQQLYEYEEGSVMSGVALRDGLNGDIYTIDGGNNRAFVHDTEENYITLSGTGPEEILFGGQAVGTHVVGELVDLGWRPDGNQVSNEGVAILDARGFLLTYHPSFSNVRAAPLGLASEWVRPMALAQFSERIYVLDPGAGQVWRYFPEGDGFYVDEAQRTLVLPELEQATDIAIYSEDGSVVVTYADGRIRRYGQDSLLWDESSLAESGLEVPLVSPTKVKIVGDGLNSSIFVADPGSGRIVQISLGGTFLAQYKATFPDSELELFESLGDFDVAETPLRIFVVAENGLYVATQD